MESHNTPNTQSLRERLQELSGGLYYISESESPFEVVHYSISSPNSDITAFLVQRLDMPAGTRVEVEELTYFFRNHTSDNPEDTETVQRFRNLQDFLLQSLQDIKVYRLGERKITALMLGRGAAREYIGLKTTVIET